MNRAQRSLFNQVMVAILVSTVTLQLIVSLTQTQDLMELVLNRGLPAVYLFRLLFLLTPTVLQYILPVTVCLAILFVYTKFAGNNEIMALRAAGVSPLGIARPALTAALVMTVAFYGLTLYLLPVSNAAFKDLEYTVENEMASLAIREGVFNSIGSDLTVYVRKRSPDGAMEGVLVRDNRDPRRSIVMIGDQATLARVGDFYAFSMTSGNRQEKNRATGEVQIVFFDRYSFEVPVSQFQKLGREPGRGISERHIGDLIFPREELRQRPDQYAKALAEGHERLAGPLLSLTVALMALAVLFHGEHQRKGLGRRIVTASGLLMMLVAAHMGTVSLARGDPRLLPLIYLVVLVPGLVAGTVLVVDSTRGPRAGAGARRRYLAGLATAPAPG